MKNIIRNHLLGFKLLPSFALLAMTVFASLCSGGSITTDDGLKVELHNGQLRSVSLVSGDISSGNLINGHHIVAGPFGIETPGMVPVNLFVEPASSDGSLSAGSSSIVNSPVMRSWVSIYVPKDRNIVFIRTRLMALAKVRLANSELNFRTCPRKFYDKIFWLPGGEPFNYEKEKDFVRGWGSVCLTLPKAPEKTGIFFTDGRVGMGYSILTLAPGDYWQARVAKNTTDTEQSLIWGGELSPMFNDVCQGTWSVILPSLKPGQQFLSEYCISVSPDPDPAKMAAMLSSSEFREKVSQARAAFDRIEGGLWSLERTWKESAKGFDPRKTSEDLKVKAVEMQIRIADIEGVLADAKIKAALSGGWIEDASLDTRVAEFAARARKDLNSSVDALNNAASGIGGVFSATRDMAQAKAVFERSSSALLDTIRRIGEECLAFELRFKEMDWRFPSSQVKRDGKLLEEEPVHGVCWFSTGTGPDGPRAELRKMKALGMNVVETGAHAYTVDAIHQAADDHDWTAVDALLKPFREAGMKAMMGLNNTILSQTPEAARAMGLPPELLAPQYNPFGKKDVPDYENPGFGKFSRDAFRSLGAYLKTTYSDVVWGFDYNNEMRWMRNTSPYAKANFLAYMKEKYGDIQGLNKAWGKGYASWEELEGSFAEVKELLDGKLGRPASIEWKRYEGNIGYGRGFWEPVYDGLKAGFPEAVCIGRDPGIGILLAQTPEHRMTDVADLHWMLWGYWHMAAHLRAVSDGKPFTNSEFWWTMWPSDEKLKNWYGEAVARESAKYRSSMNEELHWGSGSDQMWNYFMNGCNGFWWFHWMGGGYDCGMVQPNGLLRPSIARTASLIRESSLLSPLIRSTEMDSEIAVLLPESRHPVMGTTLFSAPVLALQTLNYQHDVLTEEQVAAGALSRYKYFLLTQGEVMPEKVSTAILKWIRKGGTLIGTGRIGLFDELGKDSAILSDALSVKYTGPREKKGALALNGATPLPLAQMPHPNPGQNNQMAFLKACAANDAGWTLQLSRTDLKTIGKYDNGDLAAVEVPLGKGKAVLCGVPIEVLLWEHALSGQLQGEAFNAVATSAFRSLFDIAGMRPAVSIDRRGELSSNSVQLFVRMRPGDEKRLWVFLLNIGHPIANIGGGCWYALPYVAEPQKVKVDLSFPVAKVRELLRDVDVPFSSKDGAGEIEMILEPHRIYALECVKRQSEINFGNN